MLNNNIYKEYAHEFKPKLQSNLQSHTYDGNKKDNKTCFQTIAKHLQLPNLWVHFCKHVIKQLKSLFHFVYITF
jgi:hypothetical protein